MQTTQHFELSKIDIQLLVFVQYVCMFVQRMPASSWGSYKLYYDIQYLQRSHYIPKDMPQNQINLALIPPV